MSVEIARRRTVVGLAIVAGLGGAFAAGNWSRAQAPTTPSAPLAFKAEEPANRGLDANLFMQTAAEYRACCYQAFNLALYRLKESVAKNPEGKLAVVADLDETILDNAGFQAMQLRSNLAYDQRLWEIWEEKDIDRVGLLPGAKDFVFGANKLGVSLIYISNRDDKFYKQTKQILARLGIPVEADDRLKLSTTTSDKTERRKEAERDYKVLLYLGDNLRDFDERFRCRKLDESSTNKELDQAIQERHVEVDKQRSIWGEKWIMFPNPAYGEWMKPLGRGRKDFDRLAPSVPPK